MEVHMIFEKNGRDVTGTEEVAGYCFRDYFSSNVDELVKLADGDKPTAEAWIQSAYRGPDIDGIGVFWTFI